MLSVKKLTNERFHVFFHDKLINLPFIRTQKSRFYCIMLHWSIWVFLSTNLLCWEVIEDPVCQLISLVNDEFLSWKRWIELSIQQYLNVDSSCVEFFYSACSIAQQYENLFSQVKNAMVNSCVLTIVFLLLLRKLFF